jgi:hypothetical protein
MVLMGVGYKNVFKLCKGAGILPTGVHNIWAEVNEVFLIEQQTASAAFQFPVGGKQCLCAGRAGAKGVGKAFCGAGS